MTRSATLLQCGNLLLLGAVLWSASDSAAQLARAENPADSPRERLWVKGGAEYQGLRLESPPQQVEFAEIVRPPGKPMYAIVRTFPVRDMLHYQPLDGQPRQELLRHFHSFRNKALIEAGSMEALRFTSSTADGLEFRVYDGPWFSLWSTADDATTRRAIVRVEQILRAYRQVLPPRAPLATRFRIYLHGSTLQYQAALARWKMELNHPACYSVERNVIVAGTDLDRFAAELEQTEQENERTLQQLKGLRKKHEEALRQIASDMKKAGVVPGEIEDEIRSRRSAWSDQQQQIETARHEAGARNGAKLQQLAGAMLGRLNHEAFHAYVENSVYPHQQFSLPRWFNEGLAQVFETAPLDVDTLRINAPAPALLAKLQADLRQPHPLPLAELLDGDDSFTAMHRVSPLTRRRYLYAWGLAYYLAFQRESLNTPGFEKYILGDHRDQSPQQSFEQFTGQKLGDFEALWRKDMLELH